MRIKFNVADINCCTETEGPYKRMIIWFQGCDIGCTGCCNPDFQALVPKHIMTLENILEIAKDSKQQYGIEGVTYSGGEPSLQQSLPVLSSELQKMGLGVISFTGHIYEERQSLFEGCDMVLDGPYKADMPEAKRRLLGSSNQRIIYLTDRYKDCDSWWFKGKTDKIIEINAGDRIVANGDAFL